MGTGNKSGLFFSFTLRHSIVIRGVLWALILKAGMKAYVDFWGEVKIANLSKLPTKS